MKKMLNNKGRMMVLAVFALVLGCGAVTAHAQDYCRTVRAHWRGDLETRWGYYGPYTVVMPCQHWITLCD